MQTYEKTYEKFFDNPSLGSVYIDFIHFILIYG